MDSQGDGSTALPACCISSRVCAQSDVYDLVVLKNNIQNSNSESIIDFDQFQVLNSCFDQQIMSLASCYWKSVIRYMRVKARPVQLT
jgi:hypothetical protein